MTVPDEQPARETADSVVPLRQRPIPDRLDYFAAKLALQLDQRAGLPSDTFTAIGAAVLGLGIAATEVRAVLAEREQLAARVAELEAARAADDGHRGDGAADCPACTAGRHRQQRDDDVRAVAELLQAAKRIGEYGLVMDEDTVVELVAWLVRAAGDVRTRFPDRIAELDGRDDPAYGVCECGCHHGEPECGCPGGCLDARGTDGGSN